MERTSGGRAGLLAVALLGALGAGGCVKIAVVRGTQILALDGYQKGTVQEVTDTEGNVVEMKPDNWVRVVTRSGRVEGLLDSIRVHDGHLMGVRADGAQVNVRLDVIDRVEVGGVPNPVGTGFAALGITVGAAAVVGFIYSLYSLANCHRCLSFDMNPVKW